LRRGETALTFGLGRLIVKIDCPSLRRAAHQQEAEAAYRQSVSRRHPGMALELRAFEIARRRYQVGAAIPGDNLGRYALGIVNRLEGMDMT